MSTCRSQAPGARRDGAIGRAVEDIKTRIASDAEQRQHRSTSDEWRRNGPLDLLHHLAAVSRKPLARPSATSRPRQRTEVGSRGHGAAGGANAMTLGSRREGTDSADGVVKAVASAAEQLELSIREISQLMSRSHEIVSEKDQRAGQTSSTIESLSASADSVGEVLALIGAIAGQTNLLALNATIEAAGRGKPERDLPLSPRRSSSLPSRRRMLRRKSGIRSTLSVAALPPPWRPCATSGRASTRFHRLSPGWPRLSKSRLRRPPRLPKMPAKRRPGRRTWSATSRN